MHVRGCRTGRENERWTRKMEYKEERSKCQCEGRGGERWREGERDIEGEREVRATER